MGRTFVRVDRAPQKPHHQRVKTLTPKQLEARKEKAVRFVRDVLENDDRASEIEDESLEDYAERRRLEITNPRRRRTHMPRVSTGPTKADLQVTLDEITDKANEALDPQCTREDVVATVKEIYSLAAGEDLEEGDNSDDEDDAEDNDE
jgi:hypothetical protein